MTVAVSFLGALLVSESFLGFHLAQSQTQGGQHVIAYLAREI